ncbi:tartronic semialdehyde reductase [gamma proteobacterium HTCC5015]|nr:tartronic semialdehyde reductase [gamma proteobacterium HTCC5015]
MSQSPLKVGYIGLGLMGMPMASHLLSAGWEVRVWSRRPEAADPILSKGAQWADSPATLAQQVDVLFTNVSDTPDVESVLLGEQGVIHGAHDGLIVVDNSTICADTTREIAAKLAERGVEFVDAPVSGGDVGAQAGTLSIMCGGKAAVIERLRPMLEVMGSSIVHIGDVGAGQVCKACNQILVAQQMAAVGESMMLAKAMGVDAAKVREALLGGFAQSRILDIHGQRVLDQTFEPGFKARLHNKDMGLALGSARERELTLPGAELAAQHLRRMVEVGLGDQDSSGMCQIIARDSHFDWFDDVSH